MNKRNRWYIVLCTYFCGVVLFGSCGMIGRAPGEYTHPDFKTEYTIEEHIERITARTEERFATELVEGEIVNIKVEILYAFYDNDPEYFMVDLEYAEGFAGEYPYRKDSGTEDFINYTTKYKHFIGFIENDRYYVRLKGYAGYTEDGEQTARFVDGRNPYALSGYADAKKYCGYFVHAVQTDDGLLQVFNRLYEENDGVEFDRGDNRLKQRIIPETEHEQLMSCPAYAFFYNCLY